jgi:hypothetical protein
MKRNTKPFAVEIKKSRVQGHYLPPRRLFEVAPTPATKSFQKEEPEAVVEPSPAPRILPSIVEPAWSSSEHAHKHSSGQGNREQMEFDLTTSASKDVEEPQSAMPVIAAPVSQADTAETKEDAPPIRNVQPVQGESVKFSSQNPRQKASGIVRRRDVSLPMVEQTSETEMMWALAVEPLQASERRLTKRQAAAVQLPRHERWKRRLHPASW